MLTVEIARHRNHSLSHFHPPAVAKVDVAGFSEEHSERGDDEKDAKNIKDPVEHRDQRDSQPDHNSAHHHGADDSPNQNPMLSFSRNAEMRKDQDENVNVIDAQRLLDQVT